MSDQRIRASAVFYVRGALSRCIHDMQRQIDDLEKILSEQAEVIPEWGKDSLQGIINYNKQWLSEAKAEFEKLPCELYGYPE